MNGNNTAFPAITQETTEVTTPIPTISEYIKLQNPNSQY